MYHHVTFLSHIPLHSRVALHQGTQWDSYFTAVVYDV